jgi:pilus assembly protein CpaF
VLTSITTKRFRVYEELKDKLFGKIIERISLDEIERTEQSGLRDRIAAIAKSELGDSLLTYHERQRLVTDIINEIIGFGPIEPLLKDGTVSDILINSPSDVYMERQGRLEKAPVYFKNKEHLMHIIRKLAASAGRRIDESVPMVDAYLTDGSRVNAIIPPVAVAPSVSIRKFIKSFASIQQLIDVGAISEDMGEFLGLCVKGKLNILISGGTGTGKTTLLGVISKMIPDHERIVTVEDSLELSIPKPDLVRLITRPPNVEGKGQITQRHLVINCLRMRPDRIIVGEVRGAEVWDMLNAMNTGHAGSMTTVHANSALDALYRLQTMSMLAGYEIAEATLKTIIKRSMDILVHLSRFVTGERKVVQISEISDAEGDEYVVRDAYKFIPGPVTNGKITGQFASMKMELSEKLKERLTIGGVDPVSVEKIMRKDEGIWK